MHFLAKSGSKVGLLFMKLRTQHYLLYVIVSKWLESKKIAICLKLRGKLRFCFVFLIVFGTFSHKLVQTRFVCKETWHTTLFGIFYCVELGRIENNTHMFEITCEVFFLRFF